jgi:secreted protein with Ig-like and vWFA domain
LIGTCYAPYRELLIKNHDVKYGSSAVVEISGLVYGENKSDFVGRVKLKMRMRHPITDELKWIQEKTEMLEQTELLGSITNNTNTTKQIVITIERATGLKQNSNTFVYYKFFTLKDVYTQTKRGSEPNYDLLTTHNLTQSGSLLSYLEHEDIEFILFDENVAYKGTNSSPDKRESAFEDIIGRAK